MSLSADHKVKPALPRHDGSTGHCFAFLQLFATTILVSPQAFDHVVVAGVAAHPSHLIAQVIKGKNSSPAPSEWNRYELNLLTTALLEQMSAEPVVRIAAP